MQSLIFVRAVPFLGVVFLSSRRIGSVDSALWQRADSGVDSPGRLLNFPRSATAGVKSSSNAGNVAFYCQYSVSLAFRTF